MRPYKPGGIDALEGISAETVAEICRVHITTARRYKRGEEPPFATLQLIKLCQQRELGVLDLKWAGWKLSNGRLVSDGGREFTPGEVRAIPFMKMQIAAYHGDQRVPRQADWVSERCGAGSESSENQAPT